MIARAALWSFMALALTAQGRRVQMMPVPDGSWQPVVRASASVPSPDELAIKRAASLAHQNGEARVEAVAGAWREPALAAGANRLIVSAIARADYLARSCWFNGQGEPVRHILLLTSRLEAPSQQVATSLLDSQRDFDLADGSLLEKRGQADGRDLVIGKARYPVVVVAPSDHWPEKALDVLESFINGGGKVVFLGRQPLSIQRLLLRTGVVRVSESAEDIERGLSFAVGREFHVSPVENGLVQLDRSLPNIRYQHREDARRHYYYVLNLDREHAASLQLGIGAPGAIEEWDLETGRITVLHSIVKEIPAGGSIAIVVAK